MRPWWQRVWIVQEAVLPRKDPVFQCGSRSFSWEHFYTMFDSSIHRFDIAPMCPRSLPYYMAHAGILVLNNELYQGLRNRNIPLLRVASLRLLRKRLQSAMCIPPVMCLELAFHRQAARQHDYIYGFLGLVAPNARSKIKIDYRQSHWTLYRDVLIFMACTSKHNEMSKLLEMVSYHKQSDTQPSWLPDFSSQ